HAAVLAEYTFGGAADYVLLVRVGRGVGSGLLAGGQPMAGSRFAAGEIGHVTVGTDGEGGGRLVVSVNDEEAKELHGVLGDVVGAA
ncbi:ROK family protein, partial [Microbacterium sp. B24]|uniref:ROK family protein n=1 Tax=Microbacterium sp. B24 TaxID=95616 RepID=UPI0005641774